MDVQVWILIPRWSVHAPSDSVLAATWWLGGLLRWENVGCRVTWTLATPSQDGRWQRDSAASTRKYTLLILRPPHLNAPNRTKNCSRPQGGATVGEGAGGRCERGLRWRPSEQGICGTLVSRGDGAATVRSRRRWSRRSNYCEGWRSVHFLIGFILLNTPEARRHTRQRDARGGKKTRSYNPGLKNLGPGRNLVLASPLSRCLLSPTGLAAILNLNE